MLLIDGQENELNSENKASVIYTYIRTAVMIILKNTNINESLF